MKGVIYARYSSSSQSEQSIEGQLRDCYDYAKRHNISIVNEYIDRATTGTNDNRQAFQQMIKDSDSKIFDSVICYKIDRFARNKYDSVVYKSKLKKNGIKIHYSRENIPDGPEGIILESLLEGMAEFYSAELSQKIRRGMYESATKAHATGGYLALGYQVAPDKSYEINPATAPVVVKIFTMYANGKSVVDICEELNSLGIRTSKGAVFNKNSLKTILKNKKYIGIYTCKDVVIEGGVPAIVDQELFDRVQEKIEMTRQAPSRGKGKVDYLLSGKLYCGKCSAGMVGESGTGKSGEKHHYYICVSKKRKKTCDKKTIRKKWIESLVVEETVKHILQPNKIRAIAEKCIEVYKKDTSKNDELIHLQKQLAETKKSIKNLMCAIEQGIILRTTQSRLAELEIIQDNLEYEIEVCKIKKPTLTVEQITFMLSQFQRESTMDMEQYNKDLIECFINSVHLSEDTLIITYNLTNEKTELESSVLNHISDCINPYNYKAHAGSDLTLFGGGEEN